MKNGRIFFVFGLLALATFMAGATGQKEYPLAVPEFHPDSIEWYPLVDDARFLLRVACPDGMVMERMFEFGDAPVFSILDEEGILAIDGSYTYELIRIPRSLSRKRADDMHVDHEKTPLRTVMQSGHFRILDGVVVVADETEEGSAEKDVLHYDDVITTGSLCVGFDCADGESFGFDTIILKEHNLRILFNDTSYTASYPTNSWRITVNDSTNGGASYFSIDDVDDGVSIFKIEAGAPANSLYVEDYGRIGLGTSTPVVELHIKDSDTPSIRLEQDSSGGWTAQTFDIAANESNFFIRDATNGSKLPFRIQPGTPSSTLCLKADGTVGMGTWSPLGSLHIQTTGEKASVIMERTDGATTFFASKTDNANFGSATNHPLRLVVNTAWKMQLNADNSLQMRSNAVCTSAGQWQDASSREYKENISELSVDDAAKALEELQPVRFNYKNDAAEECLGFIAEDVPDLVATQSRKTMSSMDVVAVLTRVVQEQQKLVREQQQAITELRKKVAELESKADSK
jgi:hypothetical protein